MKHIRAIKTRSAILIVVVIVVSLLLGAIVLAQSGRQWIVETRITSGGNYQLTSLTWQVSGTASGGDYRLLCPAASPQQGSGCCCVYLPMTLRNSR